MELYKLHACACKKEFQIVCVFLYKFFHSDINDFYRFFYQKFSYFKLLIFALFFFLIVDIAINSSLAIINASIKHVFIAKRYRSSINGRFQLLRNFISYFIFLSSYLL